MFRIAFRIGFCIAFGFASFFDAKSNAKSNEKRKESVKESRTAVANGSSTLQQQNFVAAEKARNAKSYAKRKESLKESRTVEAPRFNSKILWLLEMLAIQKPGQNSRRAYGSNDRVLFEENHLRFVERSSLPKSSTEHIT